jgi:hypothetical protein
VQPDSLLQALQQVSEALVCELYQGIKLVKQRHWQDLAAAAAAAVRHDDRSMSSTVPGGSEGPGDDVASATVGDAVDAYLDVLLTEVGHGEAACNFERFLGLATATQRPTELS